MRYLPALAQARWAVCSDGVMENWVKIITPPLAD